MEKVVHHHQYHHRYYGDWYYHRRIYGMWGWYGWGPYHWYDYDYIPWPFYCGIFTTEAKPEVKKEVEPPKPIQTQLLAMNVSISVLGMATMVTIEQRYKNNSDKSLEVTYSCGIGKKMAVSGFEAEIGGEKIVGEINEAKEARDKYDDKISEGHTPLLGERSSQGTFNMSLGNIQPGVEILVRIHIIVELEEQDNSSNGEILFGLPEQLFPEDNVIYDLTLNVSVDFPGGVKKAVVHCNGKVEEQNVDTTTELWKFSQTFCGSGKYKGIFAIEATPLKAFEPIAIVEEDPADASYAAQLTFFPKWNELEREMLAPCLECIFLVDRSGSMGETKGKIKRINAAKETLYLFLSSLPENSKFNIIGFGSRYTMLFSNGSQKYTDKTLKQAQAHVKSMAADLGGTNILDPLDLVFDEPPSPEYPRVIFLLTDGDVPDREEVINFVRNKAESTRIFTIGIGSDADEQLVKGIAKSARGLSDMVQDDAEGNTGLEPIVIRQLTKALEPTLRSVKVEWKGCLEFNQIPKSLPPIVSGDRLQLFCNNMKSSDISKFECIVSGIAPDDSEYVHSVVVRHTLGTVIHKLSGWKEILDLQDGLEQDEEIVKKAKPRTKALKDGEKRVADKKKMIKELGLKYGLATKFTSWIAVIHNENFSGTTMVAAPIATKNDDAKAKEENQKNMVSQQTTVAPPTTTFQKIHVPPQSLNIKAGTSSTSQATFDAISMKPARPAASASAPPPAAAGRSNERKEKKKESSVSRRDEAKSQQAQQQKQHYAKVSYESGANDDEAQEGEEPRYGGGGSGEPASSSSSSSFADYYNSSYHSSYTPNITSVHSISTWEEINPVNITQNYVSTKGNPAKIVPIAQCQDACGSWSVEALLSFYPEAKDILDKNPIKSSGCEAKNGDLLWSTSLAVCVLQIKYKDDEPTWRLIVTKAKQWIRKNQIAQRLMGVDFLGEAQKLIK